MQLQTEQTGRAIVKTSWLLLAVALNALELFIPRLPFLPWLKPGLANCITILWIIRYGAMDALAYTIIRIWISGFYFGFSILTLGLALGGGILSTVVMGVAWQALGKRRQLGTVGLGIIGALFHNMGQLTIVYVMMARNGSLFYQLPFMFGASIVFGGIIGLITPRLGQLLDRIHEESSAGAAVVPGTAVVSNERRGQYDSLKYVNLTASLIILFLSFSLLFTTNKLILICAAIIATAGSQVCLGFRWKGIMQSLRFWPLFFFIAFMYLFFSYGTSFSRFSFITHEGLNDTVVQWLRLWAWLQTVYILQRFRFQQLFFDFLNHLFPSNRETLLAGVMALQYFPEIARYSKMSTGKRRFLTRPDLALKSYVVQAYRRIISLITNDKVGSLDTKTLT